MRSVSRIARRVTVPRGPAASTTVHSFSSGAWRAPRVSRRAAAASEAVVERVLAEHLRPGVTNLAPGTARWRPPAELMPSHAAEDNFYYGACHGEPALLDALKRKREVEDGVDMSAREMMVTNGANQAYAACLLATCDPGDEIVLFQPYYFSHLVAAQLLGLTPLLLPCDAGRLRPKSPGRPVSGPRLLRVRPPRCPHTMLAVPWWLGLLSPRAI